MVRTYYAEKIRPIYRALLRRFRASREHGRQPLVKACAAAMRPLHPDCRAIAAAARHVRRQRDRLI